MAPCFSVPSISSKRLIQFRQSHTFKENETRCPVCIPRDVALCWPCVLPTSRSFLRPPCARRGSFATFSLCDCSRPNRLHVVCHGGRVEPLRRLLNEDVSSQSARFNIAVRQGDHRIVRGSVWRSLGWYQSRLEQVRPRTRQVRSVFEQPRGLDDTQP